jgi:hypothetical protein
MFEDDPDFKLYNSLQETREFWCERCFDDTLSKEEKEKAENRYIEVIKKSTAAMKRFNERWEKIEGPLPPLDDETLKDIRDKLVNSTGMEITIEELRNILDECEE